MIKQKEFSITMASGAGTDTVTGISGRILKVVIVAPAAAVTIDIDTVTDRADAEAILDAVVITGGADQALYPRTVLVKDDGTTNFEYSNNYDVVTEFIVNDNLVVTASSGTGAQVVSGTIFYE